MFIVAQILRRQSTHVLACAYDAPDTWLSMASSRILGWDSHYLPDQEPDSAQLGNMRLVVMGQRLEKRADEGLFGSYVG